MPEHVLQMSEMTTRTFRVNSGGRPAIGDANHTTFAWNFTGMGKVLLKVALCPRQTGRWKAAGMAIRGRGCTVAWHRCRLSQCHWPGHL